MLIDIWCNICIERPDIQLKMLETIQPLIRFASPDDQIIYKHLKEKYLSPSIDTEI